MTEMICAENNLNFFNYEVVPIPQADKPDFLTTARSSDLLRADAATQTRRYDAG